MIFAEELSNEGILYGVIASLCIAMNSIYTKDDLPLMGNSVWKITFYNNVNAVVFLTPLVLLFDVSKSAFFMSSENMTLTM